MSAPPRARLARLVALGYVVALLLVMASFRFIGERSGLVTIAMYLPRIGFALPLPFVVGALLVSGAPLLALGTLVVSALIIVFPLMGYQLHGHERTAPRAMRIMSWNTYHGRVDNEAIPQQFADEHPDIFLSQATGHRTKELFREHPPAGYTIENDDEFFMATRFPVVEKSLPPAFPDDPNHRPSFVRYTLQTPFGLVDLFSVHPRSPRSGVEDLRGSGFLDRLTRGALPDLGSLARNTALRRRQVETLIDAMRQAKHPVIVAGDTNLPTLSWLFHRAFGRLRDGFSEVGQGFGYSFPAKRPWVRIDRIMSDPRFQFLRFWTGKVIASDHHYVVAELTEEAP